MLLNTWCIHLGADQLRGSDKPIGILPSYLDYSYVPPLLIRHRFLGWNWLRLCLLVLWAPESSLARQ